MIIQTNNLRNLYIYWIERFDTVYRLDKAEFSRNYRQSPHTLPFRCANEDRKLLQCEVQRRCHVVKVIPFAVNYASHPGGLSASCCEVAKGPGYWGSCAHQGSSLAK